MAMSAEEFVLHHFPEMDKKCVWYPAIVGIAEGYGKYLKEKGEDKLKLPLDVPL